MLKGALGKAMWVGRTVSAVFGLALVLALVVGAASAAFGANGDFFKVGRSNLASAVSTLTKSGAGPALSLRVDRGAPLAVNSGTKVADLNSDKVDGRSFGCPGGTLFHEGVCIEVAKRAAAAHPFAHQDCADEGKRLPGVEELLTFRERSGHDFAGANAEWTSQLEYNDTALGALQVRADDGSVRWAGAGGSGITNYRCVTPPS